MNEKVLGAGNPDAALLCNNLGKLLTSLGRSEEAVPLFRFALAVLKGRLAPGHPHLRKVRKNLRRAVEEQARSGLEGKKG